LCDCLLWADFLKTTEEAQILILPKYGWYTFWAILSKTNLVTLMWVHSGIVPKSQKTATTKSMLDGTIFSCENSATKKPPLKTEEHS
jgi:hypothetical protein